MSHDHQQLMGVTSKCNISDWCVYGYSTFIAYGPVETDTLVVCDEVLMFISGQRRGNARPQLPVELKDGDIYRKYFLLDNGNRYQSRFKAYTWVFVVARHK